VAVAICEGLEQGLCLIDDLLAREQLSGYEKALDVLRIEDGLITEIVTFMPDSFSLFGLPILMDPAPEMNMRH
jgi:hypothetical protein